MTEFLKTISMVGVGTLFYLFTEASKYMMAGDFDLGVFYNTNIKPLIYTLIGAVIISALYHFLPITQQFIDKDYDITSYESLLLIGTIVGGFIKNIIQYNRKKEKLPNQEALG